MKKQYFINFAILLIAVSPLLYLFMVWDTIPLSFATKVEFNQSFEKVQTRKELLIATIVLSGVSALLYILLRNLKKIDPRVTDETPKSSFHKLGLIITMFLVGINYFLILSAKNNFVFNARVAVAFSGLFVLLIGNYLHNIKPNYVAGIRLPWTLNDPDNWRKTHLLAGKLLFAAGIILIVFSFLLPQSFLVPAIIIVVVIVVAIPGIYSYKIYRNKLN